VKPAALPKERKREDEYLEGGATVRCGREETRADHRREDPHHANEPQIDLGTCDVLEGADADQRPETREDVVAPPRNEGESRAPTHARANHARHELTTECAA
jgi:hypothetical protein